MATDLVPAPKILTPDNAGLFTGLRIVKTREIVNNGMCLGLYGGGGSGKTTMSASIQKSEFSPRVLHCDVEGGASAIAHLDIDTTRVGAWGDAQKIAGVFRGLKPGAEVPYDTVIWDNMSELQNLSIQSIAGIGNQPEIQHWGKCTADMLRFVRFWRDTCAILGINVIFICWEEIEKEESTGIWKRHVFFTPKLAAQFPGIITWIGHVMPNERDANSRLLTFKTSNKNDAKFRVAPNEAAAAIPLELVVQRDAPVLADMLDTIRGNKKWPEAKYKPAART